MSIRKIITKALALGALLAIIAVAIAFWQTGGVKAVQGTRQQSVTFGPVRTVPGTTLVLGGMNIGEVPVTLEVTYASTDGILWRERVVANQGQGGVRGFGGDSSGILGRAGSPGIAVTITAVEGHLDDIVATLQLVDNETHRPIIVLAKPCTRCP